MPSTMKRLTLPFLTVFLAALLTACGSGAPEAPRIPGTAGDAPDPTSAHAHHTAPGGAASAVEGSGAALPSAGRSVYQLPGTWRDQSGAELALADLAGRPQVVAFVYTSCAFACPRIVARMKRVEAAADADLGLVLVSIDPERDTPARLARFAESSGLDPARWTLLNGGDDRILELSVLLDVPYRAAGDGELAHANVLTLLDARGVPVARVEGLESDVAPLLAALQETGAAATPADTPGGRGAHRAHAGRDVQGAG